MKKTDLNEISEILQRFYRAFRIPVSLYSGDRLKISYVAIAFDPDPAFLYLKKAITGDSADAACICYTAHHDICCGLVRIGQTKDRILIGPVSSIPPVPVQCEGILSDIGLPFSKKRKLLYWLKKTPIFSRDRFMSLLKFLSYIINGCDENPADADKTEITAGEEGRREDLPEVYHNTLELETKLLNAIEHGKREELLEGLLEVTYSNASTGVLAKDTVRILKNIFVTTAALASRAAIRGGMDYDYALTLSDTYIREMEEKNSEADLPPMIGLMMMDYCTQVAELNKPADCSPLTAAVLSDVNRHLLDRLTVADIARRLSRSCSYISHVFEQEMHISLKKYILQRKIREAQYLLATTQKPVSEIAALLGFSSQPHFQTVFKQLAGMTPAAYRNSQQKSGSA